MPNVTKKQTPRINVEVEKLSVEGKIARDRAILEGERRFCGNKTDDISGANVIINRSERIAMLLDLRTAGGAHVDKDTYVKAKEELKDTYVAYAMQCDKFDAQKEREEQGTEKASEAVKPTSASRTKPPTWTQGLHFAPGCAHDSDGEDDGALDVDSDDDGLSSRRLELEREFSKAWKHWKIKMTIVDWNKVSSHLYFIPLFIVALQFNL